MVEAESGARDDLAGVLADGIERGVFPGAAVAVGDSAGVHRTLALGERDPETGDPVTGETVFDVASVTKPVVTATVALRLVERGALALSETLADHVPALTDRDRGAVTVGQLLAHTSGLRPYYHRPSWNSLEDALADVYAADLLAAEPGERHEYSCLNFLHLAAVVRAVADRPLADLATAHVFAPLGMSDSRVGGPVDADRVAVTYDHERGAGALRGDVHDPIGRATDGESGNAGLFTTVGDLARFARALLNGGALDGDRLLASATVDALRRDRAPDGAPPHGLGWRLADDDRPAPTWSPRSFGHTGYTGTSLWIDPANDRFAVLLTNEVYAGKDGGMETLREKFHGVVGAGRY